MDEPRVERSHPPDQASLGQVGAVVEGLDLPEDDGMELELVEAPNALESTASYDLSVPPAGFEAGASGDLSLDLVEPLPGHGPPAQHPPVRRPSGRYSSHSGGGFSNAAPGHRSPGGWTPRESPHTPARGLVAQPRRPSSGATGHGDPRTDSHSSLTLPTPTEDRVAPPRGTSGTSLPPAMPPGFFDGAQPEGSPPPPRSAGVDPRWFILAGGALLLLVIGFFAFRYTSPVVPKEMVSIVSDPDGADVFVDGVPLGEKTPAQIFDVEVGTRMSIMVTRPGFGTEPDSIDLVVTEGGNTSVYFQLYPITSLKVATEPSGAEVRVEGRRVSGLTPLTIQDLEVGKSVRLEISLPGYMPVQMSTLPDEDASVDIALVRSVALTLTTEPSGAEVFVNGESKGETPLYDVPVAKGTKLGLRIDKPGYRAVTRKLVPNSDQTLDYTLRQQSLRSLPLQGADRQEARRLDRQLAIAARRVSAARRTLARAERTFERMTSDYRVGFGPRARAEAAVVRASDELQAAEDTLFELQGEADAFRSRVLEP